MTSAANGERPAASFGDQQVQRAAGGKPTSGVDTSDGLPAEPAKSDQGCINLTDRAPAEFITQCQLRYRDRQFAAAT